MLHLCFKVFGGGFARTLGFVCYEVHKVVNVKHVSAGENTLDGGHVVLVNNGAVGASVDFDAGVSGQLVFGNKTYGKQQGIYVKFDFGAGNGVIAVHLAYDNLGKASVFADYVGDSVAEIKRNAVIVKALSDISLKTVGIRHKLNNSLYLRTLKGHTARHNKTNVAGAEDEHLFAHHIAFHIDISLGGSGGENAGGAFAGNGDGAAGSFAAAHGKNNGARVNFHIAFFLIDGVNLFLGSDGKHHGICHNLYAGAVKTVNESLGIFRTG